MRVLALVVILFSFFSTTQAEIPWPMEPFDAPQPLGNSYGEFQKYGAMSYMHPGIDILQPAGTPVYAVKAGYVKAVLTTYADLHWRVAVGDSVGAAECDGWLYAHLSEYTIAVSEGEHVDSGQYLGSLVTWTIADFHHLHFVKIRHSGVTWTSDWRFVANPLDELVNADDSYVPYFENIGTVPFRFCEDNSDNYFAVGQSLSGDVDIIVKAHDKIGHPVWVLTPYAFEYQIYSDSLAFGPFTSFVFSGELLWDQSHYTVFKHSGPCVSQGDYNYREFYEIITNHDDDTLITPEDISGNWATGQVPNDNYAIKVWAYDKFGNVAVESMTVATENYYDISGVVTTSDGNPSDSTAHVYITYTGADDSTDAGGEFDLYDQPAGRYVITATREGYETSNELYEVFSHQELLITLQPGPYVNGDVDHNGIVEISDAVYLIMFVFVGGPPPMPWSAAVYIDDSPVVEISDAVYLIDYIFNNGPPPGG